MLKQLTLFIAVEAETWWHYLLEQSLQACLGWVPALPGIALRAVGYRMMMQMSGMPAIHSGVRIKQASNITLERGVFLDHGVYLHGCKQGIVIGENTRVMYQAELHVFNFRGLPTAGIWIGHNCVIGAFNIIMGHGGTRIGNNVIIGPRVSILPVNHYYDNVDCSIRDQGISAQGIVIEDDVWIGASVVILDGVRIGKGSVIGAGAVVTQAIPPYSLAVGQPAKVIKSWAPVADLASTSG